MLTRKSYLQLSAFLLGLLSISYWSYSGDNHKKESFRRPLPISATLNTLLPAPTSTHFTSATPISSLIFNELDLAMSSTCNNTWSQWKSQRSQLLDSWNAESLFYTQLQLFTNANISESHVIQDFILARVPASYFYTHTKGEDKIPRFSSPKCRRYANVGVHNGVGLGHRLSNYLQGVLLADAFEIDQLTVNLDKSRKKTHHGSYPGMTEFLGLVTEKDFVIDDLKKDITIKNYRQIKYQSGLA
jgi:hypothetical protein